jgi:hypothetical protein
MALTTSIVAQVSAVHTNPVDLGTGTLPLSVQRMINLTSGTGANAADRLFSDTRTLAASGTEDLDLAGVLVDVFGTVLTFARIKMILVSAAAANTNNVNVSRTTSNGVPLFLAATDGIPVRPGGLFLWAAPDATAVPVTAGTGDLLTVANSAGTTGVTYDIVIIGASA